MSKNTSESPGTALTMWTNPSRTVADTASAPFNFYAFVHSALRGRYRLAIVLGLLGAVVGGMVGFSRAQPAYRSEGLLRVSFKRAALSDEAEKLRQLASFQEFLTSQVQVMTSRRVIEAALQRWTPPKTSKEGSASLTSFIPSSWKRTIRSWLPKRSEPTSQDRAREFAMRLTVRHPIDTEHLTLSFADSDPEGAAAGVRAVIDAYLEVRQADGRAEESVEAQHEAGRIAFRKELDSLQSLEREIGDQFDPDAIGRAHQGTMQRVGRSAQELFNPDGSMASTNRDGDGPVTINQIGVADPLMREYLQQKRLLEAELDRLHSAGALDANPRLNMIKRQLAAQNEIMEEYAKDYRRFQVSSRNPLSPVATGAVDARHRLAELRLAELDRQTTESGTRGTFAGKVEVITAGVVPLVPVQDHRSKLAAAGAVAGAGVPTALLMLWGMRHRRLRSADDVVLAGTDVPRLLGILPQLPTGRVSAARQSVWTFSVHQVRVMLQAHDGHDRSRAYLITSTAPGEGKTHLTIALGRSFAQSGFKTLVIDCDLIAQGLTRRLAVSQRRDLIDCLRQGSIDGCIQPADETGLQVLPVRSGVLVDGLSSASLRRLLEDARSRFDIILVDSGSVLGSIEAAMLAPVVDGVILTVTRGQQQPLVESTLRHIGAVGGKVVGTVFNRAKYFNIRTSAPNGGPALLPSPSRKARSGGSGADDTASARTAGINPSELTAGWSSQ